MDKVCVICGVRPQLIRLSRIIPKLDASCKLTLVWTNQNFTPNLKDIFFQELGLRQPDVSFEARGSLANQIADMFPKIEDLFDNDRPDKVFILGDTNSDLCSIMAERMGIPVYHMEAGNRSYDRTIPEEVNRRLIDAISSYNLCYNPISRENLVVEGIPRKRIFMCGNPTAEVLNYYQGNIDSSDILGRLNLVAKNYFLVDFHRAELTNCEEKLLEVLHGLNKIAEEFNLPVVCSIHPRTQDKLKYLDFNKHEKVNFLEAMGFFDFVHLEKYANVSLTDSGLVSEETCILGTPCVIIRNTTERPEVVETGSAVISGIDAIKILECTKMMYDRERNWPLPVGYSDLNVSDKVVQYVLGAGQ